MGAERTLVWLSSRKLFINFLVPNALENTPADA